MAVSISRSAKMAELQQSEISPERNKVWIEKLKPDRRVPVVYYLSRNGQLEHPHFMEVPLSSPRGLFLKDVINRLNALRGKGMAALYSWSCKRSYRNGFVWHDLSDQDFIYPAHGHEYVLKGSELPADSGYVNFLSQSNQSPTKGGDVVDRRRRNQSCSSIDFNNLREYSVYKTETSGVFSAASDAATQTDDVRRRRRRIPEIVEEKKSEAPQGDEIEMISPPPSDSSPETLETLMKADKRLIMTSGEDPTASGHRKSGGSKSSVLMQLISCGSISFKDCGAGGPGLGLISGYKMRLPRGGGTVGSGRVKLEEKEYFSGSLVETKKPPELFPALKRSTSCNADGSLKLELVGKEINGASTAKSIPRKPKTLSTAKKEEISDNISCDSNATTCSSLVRN